MNPYSFDKKEHLHTFEGKALTGTSGVINVLSKPLTYWASGLACETYGWVNSKKRLNGNYITIPLEDRVARATPVLERIKQMTVEEYLALGDEAYKAHATKLKDSASGGTDLHSELERFVKNSMIFKGWTDKTEYSEKIQPFIKWARENVKEFLWSEAHCFDDELWVGGISDAGAELNDGSVVVIDFKSSKEAYTAQFIQAAGYAIQIEKNGLWDSTGTHSKKIDKEIKGLIIVPFGASKVEPVLKLDINSFKDGFRHCVALYRLLGMDA